MRQGWGGNIGKAHTPGLATYKREDCHSHREPPQTVRGLNPTLGSTARGSCTKMSPQNMTLKASRALCPRLYIYLTYMQSTSCEMSHWKKHKMESRLQGEISITSDRQMIPPL